ncbi:MAG: polyprenyl synthetase family protein [Deltaproteobacteria bacterium]|nr:polyprenyl synthetase family protein [Deltaproteobacteria bacterium]
MNSASKSSVAESHAAGDLLTADMAAIERKIQETIRSREPRLTEIALHLIGAGGKRVRPLVAMSVFRACGGEDPGDMIDLGAALELIHSATLLHDDIIDGGEVRRGRASAYLRFGAPDTLVTGDFLFSRAFEICGRFEETVVRWASEACVALTEGEIMQARLRRNADVTVEDYYEIIRRKTACLFHAGARIAGHIAGARRDVVEELGRCGTAIGLAFQVIDDLLDVDGDPAQTGKPVGIDLRDGNPSLPIVLALPRSPSLMRAWRLESPTDGEIHAGLAEIRTSGALERVRQEALRYTRTATASLASLPDSPYRDFLQSLVADMRDRVC